MYVIRKYYGWVAGVSYSIVGVSFFRLSYKDFSPNQRSVTDCRSSVQVPMPPGEPAMTNNIAVTVTTQTLKTRPAQRMTVTRTRKGSFQLNGTRIVSRFVTSTSFHVTDGWQTMKAIDRSHEN